MGVDSGKSDKLISQVCDFTHGSGRVVRVKSIWWWFFVRVFKTWDFWWNCAGDGFGESFPF